jgi:hypothetical protein
MLLFRETVIYKLHARVHTQSQLRHIGRHLCGFNREDFLPAVTRCHCNRTDTRCQLDWQDAPAGLENYRSHGPSAFHLFGPTTLHGFIAKPSNPKDYSR